MAPLSKSHRKYGIQPDACLRPIADHSNGQKKLEVQFEILSRCGLNCIHCSSESDIKRPTQELSTAQIANVVESISKDVKLYTCLTGGEPLLSSQLFPILNTLRQLREANQIGLFTSGCIVADRGDIQSISDELSMRLRQAGISFCYVSLYSCSSKVHELVTTVPGSYKCAIRSMRSLLDSGIETKVNFVPMRYNRREIEKVIHFLNHLGIKEIRFTRLTKHGRAKKNWGSIGLGRDEQEVILQKAINAVTKHHLTIKITAAGFPETMDCRPFGTGKMCQAGIGLYYVDREGRVFPCACKKKDKTFSLFNADDADISKKLSLCLRSHEVKCLQDRHETSLTN